MYKPKSKHMSHFQFNKYSSIENTYQTPYLNKVREHVQNTMMWDVTEKVHGANCCMVTDGVDVVFTKRTAPVAAEEKFFNYQDVLAKNKARIIQAFNYIKEGILEETPIDCVQFYGELFGGYYPHPNVPRDSTYSAVQKGVYYAPHQEFYGFDIAIVYADKVRDWLDPESVSLVYKENDIFYAKSLFRGTLEECLNFPNAFQSHIPQWLGLPDIDDNMCEGVVIKPMIPQFFPNGERIILKNKNEKFAEKKGSKKHKEIKDVPEEVQRISSIVFEYITDNRLNNIISHEGEFDMPKEFGKCIKLLSQDVLEDFLKDHETEWNSLEKSNQKMVTKMMTDQSKKLIQEHYGIC